MNRTRRSVLLCCMLIVAGLLLARPGLPAAGQTPWPEPKPSSLAVMLLIDNSASTAEVTDIQQSRVKNARFLVDYLQIVKERGVNVYVGFVVFNSRIEQDKPLGLLERGYNLLDTVDFGRHGNGTDFREPLDFAINDMGRKGDANTKKMIVIFSDGWPSGTGLSEKDYFEGDFQNGDKSLSEIVSRANKDRIQIFMAHIGREADIKKVSSYWKRLLPESHYIPIYGSLNVPQKYRELIFQHSPPYRKYVLSTNNKNICAIG